MSRKQGLKGCKEQLKPDKPRHILTRASHHGYPIPVKHTQKQLFSMAGNSLALSIRRLSSGAGRRARIALVGAGWWSQGWHLPHLHANPRSEIAAIVDPTAQPTSPMNPDLLPVAALAEKYGAPLFASFDELLCCRQNGPTQLGADAGELDGVLIATNHASHHEARADCMSELE